MTTEKPIKQSKLWRYWKAVIRTLIKVKDFRVNGMAECSRQSGYRAVMGCRMGQAMPRGFSVSSTTSINNYYDDHKKLVRAASKRSLNGIPRKPQRSPIAGVTRKMPRSLSDVTIRMGRIEEEKSCDCGDDVKVNTEAFPRSSNLTVPGKTTRVL